MDTKKLAKRVGAAAAAIVEDELDPKGYRAKHPRRRKRKAPKVRRVARKAPKAPKVRRVARKAPKAPKIRRVARKAP